MALTLVVMAAGRGSRFGGIKQLAPIGPSGEVLFDYAVYDGVRAGFDDVVFVVSEESKGPVEEHAAAGCGRAVHVGYALQEVPASRKKPWGTGQAVLCGADRVDGPFGVVNADDFYGAASFDLLGKALADGSGAPDHVLIGFRLRESLSPNGGVSRGLCGVADGALTTITELHDVIAVDGSITCREGVDLSGDELISANLWGFQPSFKRVLADGFDAFLDGRRGEPDVEYLIGDAVARVVDSGNERVRVVPTPEPFLGITYSDDVESVAKTIAERVAAGQYPSPLW